MTALAPTPAYKPPQFLQQQTWKPLQQQQAALPGMFDTSAMTQSYENGIGSMFDQGRALAAAAGAGYVNRQMQAGASTAGAGFARAQAMLPIYAQANQMRSDLATKQLQARTAQAGASADIAGRISQLMGARQGQMVDWFGQQNQLHQNQRQFMSDLDYRNRSLAQNQSQFDTSQAERKSEFGVTSGQQDAQTRLQAMQLGLQVPRQQYKYHLDQFGNPMSPADATVQGWSNNQQDFFGNLRNQISGYL